MTTAASTGVGRNVAKTDTDRRVKVFCMQAVAVKDFAEYTELYLNPERNKFSHFLYYDAATEEKLFNAIRAGLVPRDLVTASEVIGWLMERGIDAVSRGVRR